MNSIQTSNVKKSKRLHQFNANNLEEQNVSQSAKRIKTDEISNEIISNQFMCEFCNNMFANLSNLNQHISSFHMKNSNWTCSKCKKQFTNKSNLKVHLRVHTRVKPYHCKNCNYSCMHHSSIKDHIAKNHHGVIHSSMNPAYIFNSNVVPDPDQFNSDSFDKDAFVAEAKELNNKLSAQMSDLIQNKKNLNKVNSVNLSPVSSYSANYSDEASLSNEQSFSSFEDHDSEHICKIESKANVSKPKYTAFNIDSIINDSKKTVYANNLNLPIFQNPFNSSTLMQTHFDNQFLFDQVDKFQYFYSYLYNMQSTKQ